MEQQVEIIGQKKTFKIKEISFSGVRQTRLSYNPAAAPRGYVDAVNLTKLRNSRTEAKQKLLDDLADEDSKLGKKVRDVGVDVGREETGLLGRHCNLS